MPVHKVKGGYQWGNSGKVYPDKASAERQGRAAYANGYKGDAITPDQFARVVKDHAAGGDVATLGMHRGTTSPTKPVPDDGDFNQKVRPKKGSPK